MDLNQLETFLAVVEQGSFSRAAERLGRTQPAVSLAIKKLEEEIGEPLVDRSTKGGSVTEAGKTLASYGRRMVHLRDEALDSLRELGGLIRGRLSLGANESLSQFLVPPMIRAFRLEHPTIKVALYRSLSERIPLEILERNLDFGFLAYEPTDPLLTSTVLCTDAHVLVVAPDHPLAGRKDATLADLGREPFLVLNARTPSRIRVLQAFAQAGVPLQISMELDSLHTMLDFVAEGLGVAILPFVAVHRALAQGRVVRVPVADLSIHRTLRLVYRRDAALSSAAKAFLGCALAINPLSGP